MHGHRSLRFSLYAVALAALAVALLVWATRLHPLTLSSADLVGVLVMGVLVVTAEVLAVALPNQGAVSLSYPVSMAAVLVFGPFAGGLIAAGAALSSVRPKGELWAAKSVFNMSQLAISATLAGLAYHFISHGRYVAQAAFSADVLLRFILPALGVLVLTGVACNFVLIGFGARILYGVSLRDFWASSLSWMTLTQIALGFVGYLIAQIYVVLGVLGFGLFVLPLVLARETYQQYLRLRETYTDAVRSLVTAIEAKDAYTKGHSVRVAELAVAMAADFAFDPQHVSRLEIAALLHDLGKVGVSRTILSKPGTLTAEEMQQIRKHPDIGAGILEGVPFLQDVVPWVAAHHERADGKGYGHGLTGLAIPLEARILAVADCYDAMTSARSYRAPLGQSAAVEELRACSGTQFDGEAVESLCRVLGETMTEPDALPGLDTAQAVTSDE
jgi:putative nucleotidyltransferase with HDIG domain